MPTSARRVLVRALISVVAVVGVAAVPGTVRAATPANPAGTPVADPSLVASIPFDPVIHGFGFSNWGDIGPTDDVDVTVVRRLFGDPSVCRPTADGACVPYASVAPFVTRLDLELSKGRCEGMVVAAFARYRAALPGTDAVALADAVDEINFWSATQILPGPRLAAMTSSTLSFPDLVSRVIDGLRSGGGDVLGLSAIGAAHSVLPIAVRMTGSAVSISVYDSNHPRTTQRVDIDLQHATWTYRPLSAPGIVAYEWAGTTGSLSLVPFSSRIPQPIEHFRNLG